MGRAGRWLGRCRAVRRALSPTLSHRIHTARDHHQKTARGAAVPGAGVLEGFPKTPAWEFARFLALAKSGRQFLGNMVIGQWSDNSPILEAALKGQQRIDFECSLEYAKKKLGVGIRWRG